VNMTTNAHGVPSVVVNDLVMGDGRQAVLGLGRTSGFETRVLVAGVSFIFPAVFGARVAAELHAAAERLEALADLARHETRPEPARNTA
jgi:NADPH-dependent 2,4-dienoyl-CoA reductase/sulfur reductase-like enzyme